MSGTDERRSARPAGIVPTGPAAAGPVSSPGVPLRLCLLGGFRVERADGVPAKGHWRRGTARTLVKMLAVAPARSLHREVAAEALWPGSTPATALRNLRVTVHAARQALEPGLVARTPSSYLHTQEALLVLDPELVTVDADLAERRARCALDGGDASALVGVAAALVPELLPEDRYADWAEERRRTLSVLRDRLIPALASAWRAEGEPERAVEVLRAAVERAPADEPLQLLLADTLLDLGRPRQAIRQYHVCRAALFEEVGAPPGPALLELYRRALARLDVPAPAVSGIAAPLPETVRRMATAPLFGRERPLALLTGQSAPLALVRGEAGIGKTRLIAEAARRAADEGSLVLWGAGHESEGERPYGALADALDGWLAPLAPAERAAVTADHPELAAIVGSLGWDGLTQSAVGGGVGGPSGGPGGPVRPDEARARLFRAVSVFLTDLAAARPLLLVLDDVHAADPASLRLLHHLVRTKGSRAWRFVAAYRDDELPPDDPRRLLLDTLVEQRLAVAADLLRLGRADCARLAGNHPRIYQLSRGNPLFALELAAAPETLDTTGEDSVPTGIGLRVRARLAALPEDARRLTAAAAVAGGGGVALADLESVAARALHPPLDADRAAAAVAAALDAGLMEEHAVAGPGPQRPGVVFRHPLVRMACADQLSTAVRRRVHTAYAEAALARRPAPVDALAFHLSRADDPRATTWLARAAARAAALYANDSACSYYEDLVTRLDAVGDAAAAAARRRDWAKVLRTAGRYQDAERVLTAARDTCRAEGDEAGELDCVVALAEVLGRAGAPRRGLDVLASVPRPRRGADLAAAEAQAAYELAVSALSFNAGEYDRALRALGGAERAAVELPDEQGQMVLSHALSIRASCLLVTGDPDTARACAERALVHAERCDRADLISHALSVTGDIARRQGRLTVARDCARRAVAASKRTGDPAAVAFDQGNLAAVELLLSDTVRATALARAAVRTARSLGRSWCLPYALAALAEVRLHTGHFDEAGDLLAEARSAAQATGDAQILEGVRELAARLEEVAG